MYEMKPLFLPLNAEHYNDFKEGSKAAEYRLLGGKWNQRQVVQGRRAILSCGYGKQNRITGIIGQVQIKPYSALNKLLQSTLAKIYSEKLKPDTSIISFDIRIDR